MTTTHPFRVTERRLQGRHIEFHYALGEDEFVERVELDTDPSPSSSWPLVEEALDLAHVLIGVSYYKLAAPGEVVVEHPIATSALKVAEAAYSAGLAEFAERNGLDLPHQVSWKATTVENDLPPLPHRAARRALVPVGGGKDSALALAVIDDATALAINPTDAQRAVAAAASVPLIGVRRTLDPLLFQRNAEGGLNGHVPVTAINSALAVLVALLLGLDDVVFANERSADEETRVVGGVAVNHQYSKSWEFEKIFEPAAARVGVTYFSLTRRLSELSIVSSVAAMPELRRSIISCNRAYTIQERASADRQRWCLRCAKCLFTFLMFAVFLSPEEANEMFAGDPLTSPELGDAFADLWSSDKPFDCVGERRESAAAMDRLSSTAEWGDHPVVRSCGPSARAVLARDDEIASLLRLRGDDAVPDAYRYALLTSLETGRRPLAAIGPSDG